MRGYRKKQSVDNINPFSVIGVSTGGTEGGDDMNKRPRRIAEDVFLALLIEHAESDEDRTGRDLERAQRGLNRGTRWHPTPAQMPIPCTDDDRVGGGVEVA